MPTAPKEITPQMLAEARRLYVETQVPVEAICVLLGIGTYTFHKRLKAWGWPMRSRRIPTEPPPEPDAPDDAAAPAGDSARVVAPASPARTAFLIARLQESCARDLDKIDRIVGRIGEGPEDVDAMHAAMKMRASAGRTLRELHFMERAHESNGGTTDDGFPRSDEELRAAILRKMDALDAGTSVDVPVEPHAAGARTRA